MNETFDLIEQITRNDGSVYFELGNISQNGRAEYAAEHGYIKEVRILKMNIPKSTNVEKVTAYINAHYQEEIRLNQLADMVGMTPVSFSRFFKLRTGKNLSDYIIDIRLGFAARLLVDSTMSIAEICYECGFNNLSNFNRIFKKKKECSPKEFRENYRKKKKLV